MVNEFGLPADIEWLYAPDVPYAQRDTGELRMQLIFPYRPQGLEDRFPVVLFVPGAAWYRQEMYNSVPQWARLAERGVVVAAVQVRASTEAKFPAQTDDLLETMQAIAAQAERWHIDPHRMYLCGQSSGGHIALLTALRQWKAIAAAKAFTLCGVMAVSAPTDLLLCGGKPSCDLLGVESMTDAPEMARGASCGTYISGATELPPVLLLHGDADNVVPPVHSSQLHMQLEQACKRSELVLIPGAGHGGAWQWRPDVINRLMAFIRR
nr:alpha/beta hydrolase [Clostridia bacterium]